MIYSGYKRDMEDKQKPEFVIHHYQDNQVPQRSPKQIKLIILFLVLLLALIGGYIYISQSTTTDSNSAVSLTPTPTDVFPSDTPIPTEPITPTESVTKTPTPRPTTNPIDKATGLDRSDLTVAVRNGSGETGVGTKASEILKSFGYHIVSIGNADNFNYENVVVQVAAGKSKYLDLLKKDLATVYTIGSTSAQLSASVSADAVVVVGKQ